MRKDTSMKARILLERCEKKNNQTNKTFFSLDEKLRKSKDLICMCVYMAQTIPLSTVLANQVSKAGASLLFWGWWSHTEIHPGFLVLTTTQRYFSLRGDVMSNLNTELQWVQQQNLDVLLKSQWS